MYQALIMACVIGTSNMTGTFCKQLESQTWQDTEQSCQSHALVLAERVHKYMPGYKPVGWTCRVMPKGVLSR